VAKYCLDGLGHVLLSNGLPLKSNPAMRYPLIFFFLISQWSFAQEWRVNVGLQQVRTYLVGKDLPKNYNLNRTLPFYGAQIGVERDLGRWVLGTRFLVAEMEYEVQRRYLTDTLNLVVSYRPIYYNYSGEFRIGRKLWASGHKKWHITPSLGFSVHRAIQVGHENGIRSQTVGPGLIRVTAASSSPIEQKGWYQTLDAGIEVTTEIGRQSYLGITANYQHALSKLPTAYHQTNLYFYELNNPFTRSEIREEITPRLNRLVIQLNYFYRFGKGVKASPRQ
jgi:hypothetical protein